MNGHEKIRKEKTVRKPRDDSVGRNVDWIAERRERLDVITQETRFDIVQNIVAHPFQLPSLKELDTFMGNVQKSTIRNHLDKLQEANVVAQVELPEDERARDLPHVFYGLTQSAYDDLEAVGLVDIENVLQEATLRTDIPQDVEAYMNAPRPEWGPANEYQSEGDTQDSDEVKQELQ